MKEDIIYREDAIDKLNEWESECVWDSWTLKYKDDPKEHIVAPTDVVKNLPSAERTGKWIRLYRDGFGNLIGHCDKCGRKYPVDNFCPNCGVRMVKE